MSEQLTIDELSEGERLRDEGTARVTEAADTEHIVCIDCVIRDLNNSGTAWSANTLRERLVALHPDIVQARPHLMGARVRAAASRRPREMVKVGREKSSLPSTHAAEVAVWRGVDR